MTQVGNEIPAATNWADEIDELNRRVTEKCLEAVFWKRFRRKPEFAAMAPDDEIVNGAGAEKDR